MSQNHVIQRITCEVNSKDFEKGREIQNEIASWLKSNQFWQKLNEKFDEVLPEDIVLTIPKIEIDVNFANENEFISNFSDSLLKIIKLELEKTNNPNLNNKPENLAEISLFFLENGYLPSFVSSAKEKEVQDFLIKQFEVINISFLVAFKERINTKPQIIDRFIQHFGSVKAELFFIEAFKFKPIMLDWLSNIINKTSISKATIINIWRRILTEKLTEFQEEKPFVQFIIINFWNEIKLKEYYIAEYEQIKQNIVDFKNELNAKDIQELESNKAIEVKKNNSNKLDFFYINNGGLVLLCQYIPELFKGLGWILNNQWRSEADQHLAVFILQYLAVGDTAKDSWEYDWTLNKILCGLPLETVIEQNTDIDREIFEAADSLIYALISQWQIMKNATISGLQENFIQRKAKLTYRAEGEGWLLQVERKTEDILLDRLPLGWNYSVIRMPWMAEMIFVEW